MAATSKTDQKAALDIASWLFNVVTSVGIILVNKALMATYGFSFDRWGPSRTVYYTALKTFTNVYVSHTLVRPTIHQLNSAP
ncbi:hypothetical protein F2Q68_00005920 [Brassica cretica]|uniref:Uncharacterized protein n=1 Tax=Brassica cretica TaxID=69181 RepID=A0A8S9J892_BRACR|nr:hypothetical protein F2Q68_00005920 [Brassica cretica]